MLESKDSFTATLQGRRIHVRKGQTIDESHPVAKQFRHMFKEAGPDIRTWEDASAARSVVVPSLEDDDLEQKSLGQLQHLAVMEGVSSAGTKGDLVKRIKEKREE